MLMVVVEADRFEGSEAEGIVIRDEFKAVELTKTQTMEVLA
jgi:hypothetical protein